MVEDALKRTRHALVVAAESPRLELLLHAFEHQHVAPRDVRLYATLSPRSGTGQYHVGVLVGAGLLERSGRGEYALTPAGRSVVRLADALRDPYTPTEVIEVRL